MLLSLDAPTVYESAVLPHVDGVIALVAGFSGVPFLSLDGTSVAGALEGISTVDAIFRFNNERGGWDSFRSALPPALNDLQTLNRWDVLLVSSTSAGSWSYPAFTPE